MIDKVGGSLAPMVAFMTGQFRDSEAGKTFSSSLDTAIVGPAAADETPVSTHVVERQLNSAVPDTRQNFNAEAIDAPDSFAPKFRKATGSDGTQRWELNSTYFASSETAQWIASKYGSGEVVEVPFGGVGGIYTASANEYHIRLDDGRLVNAGILAGYYERNPPDQFPGVADKLIRAQLGLG